MLSFLLYLLALKLCYIFFFFSDTTLWLFLSPGPNILPFPRRVFLLLADF
jgi:hypothetical protein